MTVQTDAALTGRVLVGNFVLAAWLVADAVRAFILAEDLGLDLVEIVDALALIVAATFVVLRSAPLAQDLRVSSIAITICAAFVPVALQLLSRPAAGGGSLLRIVEASAVVLLTLSILYLGRSFSLVPQYRSLVADGPYSIVRHPMYGSYMFFDGALALGSGSWVAGVLWLLEAVLLLLRAQREEQLLESNAPNYRAYAARVRYRFVPFVV